MSINFYTDHYTIGQSIETGQEGDLKMFNTILKAISDKKAENIVSLDLRGIPESVADFFIICEADNTTQLKAICDHVEFLVEEECGEKPYKREGLHGAHWVLTDYVNVVVHIMKPDARSFYNLEELWCDAKIKEHKPQ